MRQKISVSIDGGIIKLVEQIIKEGTLRNKSHTVEFSLNKIVKEMRGK